MSAESSDSPAASSVSVREAARLASTASPSAPPIMNDVLTTPEASPASLRLDVAHRGEQHRVEGHARAEAEQDHARQDVDEEVPVHRRAREEHEPDGRQHQARDERRPDAEAHDELRREPDENAPMIRFAGQERETDLERAVAEHELEVEGGEEEPGEHRGGPEDADAVRGRHVAQPEEAERHERRLDAATR